MGDLGQWIWADWDGQPNQYILAKQRFTVEEIAETALRISADSQYTACVNGRLVAFGQYADYTDYKVFDEVDVTGALHVGDNELLILAYCQVTNSSVYRAGRPALWFELTSGDEIIVHSGAKTWVSTTTGYRSGAVDRVSGQMGYTFEYDANDIRPEWVDATVLTDFAPTLYPRPDRRLIMGERIPARAASQGVFTYDGGADTLGQRMQYAALAFRENKALTGLGDQPTFPNDGIRYSCPDGDGVYVTLDLGCERVGFIELELTTDTVTEVMIGWGEHLDDGRVRTYVGGRHFAARYITSPGANHLIYTIRRVGLRYITLYVGAHDFALRYAGIRPVDYPLDDTGVFRTADGMAMRIYDGCKATLRRCLHEHYEDCPWREQALYAMDSRNQMLCGYYAFNEYAAPRASMELIARSMREDGLPELCSPGRVSITIPSFALDFALELEEYLRFSGDREFAKKLLPTARRIVDSMAARIDATGLVPAYSDPKYWNFYEWRPGMDGELSDRSGLKRTRYDAPLNLLLAEAMRRVAVIARETGADFAESYSTQADALARAADATFWSEADGVYHSYLEDGRTYHVCELTNALAVYCGAARGERRELTLAKLADESLPPVSISYSVFLFDALLSEGDRYARAAFKRIDRIWGGMIAQGATTFWETEAGGWDFDRAGSLCHAWSAVPLYLYYAYALGIRPTKPGFEAYEHRPLNCGLYEVGGVVVKPDGEKIECEVNNHARKHDT